MKHIQMDGKYDCGAACIASVLGLTSARAVYPLLGYDPNETELKGTMEEELSAILTTCDITHTRYLSLECLAHSYNVSVDMLRMRVKVPSEKELQHILGTRKGSAIVGVPFLGDEAPVPQHFVLVHDGEVYDPARGRKRYIGSAQSLPICSAVIVHAQGRYKYTDGLLTTPGERIQPLKPGAVYDH